MDVAQWVDRLYPYAHAAFTSLDSEMKERVSLGMEIPTYQPEDSTYHLARFEEALSAMRSNVPVFLDDRADFELDVVSGLITRRLQEIGTAVNDIAKVGPYVEDPSSLAVAVKPLMASTIALVSLAGAINSDRGQGICGDNAMTKLYRRNEIVIARAFLVMDDPVNEFLDRSHGSDLGAFGGALLAYAHIAECQDFELALAKEMDFRKRQDCVGYENFDARALNLVAMRAGNLPTDFWETYFDTVYALEFGEPDISLPGTFEWAQNAGFLNLFAELADKDMTFFQQLCKHIGNEEAFFFELFPDYKMSLGPDMTW